MLGKYTVRIDANKQVSDLFRRDLDEAVGGIRRNDNNIPWANSLSRTTSNHFADRTWTDEGTHIRIVRWKLSLPFYGPAGDQDSSSLEHVINLGNVVVQNSVRRRLSIHLYPADNRNADIVLTVNRHYTQHISDPTHVHGAGMPGLAALKASAPGDLQVQYRDVRAGGEIEYRSDRQATVTALHEWFDAQVSDHGHDAMMGHDHATPH
jgi:hypothetical protein